MRGHFYSFEVDDSFGLPCDIVLLLVRLQEETHRSPSLSGSLPTISFHDQIDVGTQKYRVLDNAAWCLKRGRGAWTYSSARPSHSSYAFYVNRPSSGGRMMMMMYRQVVGESKHCV